MLVEVVRVVDLRFSIGLRQYSILCSVLVAIGVLFSVSVNLQVTPAEAELDVSTLSGAREVFEGCSQSCSNREINAWLENIWGFGDADRRIEELDSKEVSEQQEANSYLVALFEGFFQFDWQQCNCRRKALNAVKVRLQQSSLYSSSLRVKRKIDSAMQLIEGNLNQCRRCPIDELGAGPVRN